MNAGDPTASGRPGPIRRLLRVPLFYKVFLANACIMVGAVAVTAWLARAYFTAEPDVPTPVVWVVFAVVVLLVSLAANAVLIRLALSPLRGLEQTARRISAGETDRRAPLTPLADRDLEGIVLAFNEMLERLGHYRERLRDLSARSLDAQERERMRLAHELHDDTAQRMTALGLRLAVLRRKAGSEELAEEVAAVHAELLDAVEELRRVARGLRPPALDELGLVPAVEAYARELSEQEGASIRVSRPESDPQLTPEADLAAYRIVQEAVINAHRHAEAGVIQVSFTSTPVSFQVAVEDDGRGFDPDEVLGRGGENLGLFGMEERAAYVGADLDIRSAPGRGTRITLSLPSRARSGP